MKRESEDQPEPKRQKRDDGDSAESSTDSRKKEDSEKEEPTLATLNMIAEKVSSEGLKNLRDDWSTQPWNVAERKEHLTGVFFDDYIGLEDITGKMLYLYHDSEERKRPALGMVNGVAGKSAAFQYCEEFFNNNKTCANNNDPSIPVALAVTFGRFTSDLNTLDASQGLTLRIAERFLMKQGEFDGFREMWKRHCMEVLLLDLIQDIYSLLVYCRGTRRRILILVDEPCRAGSRHRKGDDGTTDADIAKEVVNATSIINRTEKPPPEFAWATRFAFTSLKPVFDGDKELSNETKSRGPVDWIFLPYVKSDAKMKEVVTSKLEYLKERMPERDFARAIDFLLAMTGGHWATANAMVKELEALDNKDEEENKHIGLATIYFQHVRDVIVQVRERSAQLSSVTKHAVFEDLLALSILGKELPPFQEVFEYWKGNDILRTLNDFAYDRIISNRIRSDDGSSFAGIVPRLSLLLIRRWCLEQRDGYEFSDAIRRVLQHPGNNATSTPRQPVVVASGVVAFEGVPTAFLHAKFIAWKRAHNRIKSVDDRGGQVFVVKRKIPLTLSDDNNCYRDQPFFPGRDPVYGAVPGKMMMPTSKPRLLHIKGTGGFHGKKEEPKQYEKEPKDQFEKREREWCRDTMKELCFVEGTNIPDVGNGDVICPGSKNHAHSSDAITVVRFAFDDEDGVEKKVPGLVYNQFKFFSDCDAYTTAVDSSHINAGLEKLLKERGLLFDVPPKRSGFGNQIAKLNVKEEHVVYCWSVLRESVGLETLRRKVDEYASRMKFKGSVVVAVSNKV